LAAASHFQAGPLMLWAALLLTARRALTGGMRTGDETWQQHRREQARAMATGIAQP
jgi:hypothetical protein